MTSFFDEWNASNKQEIKVNHQNVRYGRIKNTDWHGFTCMFAVPNNSLYSKNKFYLMTKFYASIKRIFIILLVFLAPFLTIAQPPTITYSTVATGYSAPINIAN